MDIVKFFKDPKKLIGICAVIVVVAVVLTTFYSFNGNSLSIKDKEVRIIVTDSMDGEPHPEYPIHTIPKGAAVMVKKFSSDEEKLDLPIGTVLQFKQGGHYNHHRIIGQTIYGYVTQGDNSETSETVQFKDATGVVIGVSKGIGTVLKFIKSYWFLIIGAIVILYVASIFLKSLREGKEKEKELQASTPEETSDGVPPDTPGDRDPPQP